MQEARRQQLDAQAAARAKRKADETKKVNMPIQGPKSLPMQNLAQLLLLLVCGADSATSPHTNYSTSKQLGFYSCLAVQESNQSARVERIKRKINDDMQLHSDTAGNTKQASPSACWLHRGNA